VRIDPARNDRFKLLSLVRAVLYAIGSVLIFAFASFWLVIGVTAMFVATEYPIANGVLFILFGFLIPGAGGVLLTWRSIIHFRRLSRMRRFITALSSGRIGGLEDLVQAMGVKPAIVRATAFEAVNWGILGSDDVLTLTSSARDRQPAAVAPAGYQQPLAPSVSPSLAAASTMAAAGPAVGYSQPQPQAQPASNYPAPLPSSPPMSMPLQSWIGRTLKDTWHIEALLGHGGMGAVFRTRHLRTGRRYALKVMLSRAELTAEALHRFEREATAASALGHQGIVAVHDFDRTPDGAAYLVMDLLEGETLQQRLERRGMLPWPEARRIALDVGDALATAHDANLLHRDVKPGNIFLARERTGERVVLLDFGLVKRMGSGVVSRVTASGAVVGTPLYMSPEQARGEPLDARSDLYGLAVVVFEMVVGVPPFFDRSQAAVYARLLREPAPKASSISPDSCPPGFDDIVGRALATRREERQDSVRTFLGALAVVGAPQSRKGRTAIL
jgi:Protein kinase domain